MALLDDSGPGEVPREALGGSAALAPWVYLSFDPGRLARAAGRAFAEMSPLVPPPSPILTPQVTYSAVHPSALLASVN